jgi:hypothetical protein
MYRLIGIFGESVRKPRDPVRAVLLLAGKLFVPCSEISLVYSALLRRLNYSTA